ncbi:MAG: hypothetical protein OXI24_14680, partial [Candidatus Poribacteria bacterium]|nr:hypothetical protein [Candidatus Poribacteria bacterium]
ALKAEHQDWGDALDTCQTFDTSHGRKPETRRWKTKWSCLLFKDNVVSGEHLAGLKIWGIREENAISM